MAETVVNLFYSAQSFLEGRNLFMNGRNLVDSFNERPIQFLAGREHLKVKC